jgi:hypothetical protein
LAGSRWSGFAPIDHGSSELPARGAGGLPGETVVGAEIFEARASCSSRLVESAARRTALAVQRIDVWLIEVRGRAMAWRYGSPRRTSDVLSQEVADSLLLPVVPGAGAWRYV